MKSIKVIMFIFSLFLSGYVSAATITTVSSNVNVNDVFSVDIIGTDFTGNVDGGGINVSFDQNVLNVLSVSIDESVWNFGSTGIDTGFINNSTGTVDGIMVNTFADVTGDFVIATIEFQAISGGDSLLLLTELGINPWASSGSLINPDFATSSVNVSAVPVPAALWLFVTGLIGVFGFIRRR